MLNDALTTYLRTYRRRTGLSQDEVAFLLCVACGCTGSKHDCTASGTLVSRHESGSQWPKLRTAFAYEIILGIPLKELYAGYYETLQATIRLGAARLLEEMPDAPSDPRLKQKVEAIRRIMKETA